MVLGDHVTKGKKLLPPMMAAGHHIELGECMLDRVPEFFWLAMLVNRIGLKAASEHVVAMSKTIQSTLSRLRRDKKVFRAHLFCEHSRLTKEERISIARTCAKWTVPIKPLIGELKTVICVVKRYNADFDNDGDVDSGDLTQWGGDFGANGLSDADGDGDSDGVDFLTWQRQLGSGPPVTSAFVPVPEPATAALLILAAISVRSLQTEPQRKFQKHLAVNTPFFSTAR
jgi:hypothetical protein